MRRGCARAPHAATGGSGRDRPPAHRPPAWARNPSPRGAARSEEHTSELQSRLHLVCRLLLEKKKKHNYTITNPRKIIRPLSNIDYYTTLARKSRSHD